MADVKPTEERQVLPRLAAVAQTLEAVEMPPQSLALYARWWQLETWLRELAYVELRAGLGTAWTDPIRAAANRLTIDARFSHMAGADNENPLAYLDYSQLVEVISDRWEQLGYALLEQRSWEGRQAELRQIRHRIGHLRSPHEDDLGRLEQTLRDLERGAFIALSSYNQRHTPDAFQDHDPVTEGWINEQHEDARRLVKHAYEQYETQIRVSISERPWANRPANLNGASGVLWHVAFFMRGRALEAARLWHYDYLDPIRPLIVHMLADDPQHVGFTFSAVDDGIKIADAIGRIFDAIILVSDYRTYSRKTLQEHDEWHIRAKQIDYRVLSRTGWNIVDGHTLPISIFGAGGGVQARPAWPRPNLS